MRRKVASAVGLPENSFGMSFGDEAMDEGADMTQRVSAGDTIFLTTTKSRAEYPLLLDIDRTTWPNCLAICGMCTPDTPLDYARVADLQKMMVRILITRSKWSNPEGANPRLQEDLYPWTWAPELDTTTQHEQSIFFFLFYVLGLFLYVRIEERKKEEWSKQ